MKMKQGIMAVVVRAEVNPQLSVTTLSALTGVRMGGQEQRLRIRSMRR
jgi:hypothetical protein